MIAVSRAGEAPDLFERVGRQDQPGLTLRAQASVVEQQAAAGAQAKVVRSIPVTGAWQEPLKWQQPRPAIFVRGDTAYVNDPNTKELSGVRS
ncbi:hypothetical protein [Pseudonocardia asaccharolytica]|uniref:hypothetical protein n=1 Tax=Pseudonocardia asaccharolytica TaxID=54010 RepID=UPI000410BD9B|nr:hypothetical protein [Pseudonocardia asaccharolytica]